MSEERLRELLRDHPLPEEREAEQRAWRVTEAAFQERQPGRFPVGPRRGRIALAVAIGVVLAAALALTPAGARVGELIDDVVVSGEDDARPALTSLPAPGQLLVESGRGPWVVHGDGSKRLLGAYDEASWAPRGRFATVTRDDQLIAVVADPEEVGEPAGTVRWSVTERAPVRDPVWSPRGIRAGFRVAYSSSGQLRTVSGTGTELQTIAERVAAVTPAWRPGAEHVLAYAGADGSVHAVDGDSGTEEWSTARLYGAGVDALSWSPSGTGLLILTRSFYSIVDRSGRPQLKWGAANATLEDAAYSPTSDEVALIRARRGTRTGRSELVLSDGGGGRPHERVLYREPGRLTDLTWSPDGEWVLLAAPDTDRWTFVRVADGRTISVSDIASQFDPGARGDPAFPRVSGWCCPPG